MASDGLVVPTSKDGEESENARSTYPNENVGVENTKSGGVENETNQVPTSTSQHDREHPTPQNSASSVLERFLDTEEPPAIHTEKKATFAKNVKELNVRAPVTVYGGDHIAVDQAPCDGLEIQRRPGKGALLKWCNNPIMGGYKVQHHLFVVTLNQKVVEKSDELSANKDQWSITGDKLDYGKMYTIRMYTTMKYEGRELKKFIEIEFPTKPHKPKVEVDPDSDTINVDWTHCEGADKYVVKLCDLKSNIIDSKTLLVVEDGTCACQFQQNETKKIFKGRKYQVKVISLNRNQENPSDIRTFVFGGKYLPRNVTAELKEGKVVIHWEKPLHPTGLINYEVLAVTDKEKSHSLLTKGKETTYSIEESRLKGGSKYKIQVAAVYENIPIRGYSSASSIETAPRKVKVEGLQVERDSDKPEQIVHCIWKPTQDATAYRLKCQGPLVSKTLEIKGGTRATIAGLSPNSEYTFMIKASTNAGYGSFSESMTMTTGFGKVTNLNIEVDCRNQLAVSFDDALDALSHEVALQSNLYTNNAICDANAPDTPNSNISQDGQDGKNNLHTANAGEIVKPFCDIAPNSEYWVEVTAIYSAGKGNSEKSDVVLTAPAAGDIEIESDKNDPYSAFLISVKVHRNTTRCQAWITHCGNDSFCEEVNHYDMKMVGQAQHRRAEFLYRCFYQGVAHRVKIRTKSSGKFSTWSEEKGFIPAPRQVKDLEISFENDSLVASWTHVEHAISYALTIHDENRKIFTDENAKSPHSFTEASHGVKYHCEIFAENKSGRSKVARSNTLWTPLDPPKDLAIEDVGGKMVLKWKKSTGMQKALIHLYDGESNKEFIEQGDVWSPQRLAAGKVYTVKIWGQNKNATSKAYVEETFVTAPSKVELKRNERNPETCIDVQIVSDYSGPFIVRWECFDEATTKVGTRKRSLRITGLLPATTYKVSALCVYGRDLSRIGEECYREQVMTLPAQVTGLKFTSDVHDHELMRTSDQKHNEQDIESCSGFKPTGCKTLKWVKCGKECVEYKITWSRNYVYCTPLVTYQTSHEFHHLEPGNYTFYVSAGGGKNSVACSAIIPGSPSMDVEVLSKKNIRVVFHSEHLADKYTMELKDDSTDEERNFKTTACHCTIGESGDINFQFQEGVKYSITGRAWFGQMESRAITKEFYTGLKIPTEYKCVQSDRDPRRQVAFTWKNSKGMFSAKIQLKDSGERIIVETYVTESRWVYRGLEKNRTYRFLLWPGDGRKIFEDDCFRDDFTTAPDPPRSVQCKPFETGFQIEIDSDYEGKFKTEVETMDGRIVGEKVGFEKSFTIAVLQPGTQHLVSSKCLYKNSDGPSSTEKTYAHNNGRIN